MNSTRWTRRHVMGAGVATAVVALMPRAARAATTLRWATVLPTNHPSVAMMERVAKQVREETGGAVEIQTFPGRPARIVARPDRSGVQRRDPDRRRRRGAVRPVRAAVLDPRSALHLARRGADAPRAGLAAGRRDECGAGRQALDARRRLDVLRQAPRHVRDEGDQHRRRHEGLQAAHSGGRHVPRDGRGLGRAADAAQHQRALPRAEPGRGGRPGKSAADHPEQQVLRSAEVPGADRSHHHAAPHRRERGRVAGAEREGAASAQGRDRDARPQSRTTRSWRRRASSSTRSRPAA